MLAVVYTKDNCPACKQLKERFIREGQFFEEVRIGTDITREEFIERFPHVRMMPHLVFANDE